MPIALYLFQGGVALDLTIRQRKSSKEISFVCARDFAVFYIIYYPSPPQVGRGNNMVKNKLLLQKALNIIKACI